MTMIKCSLGTFFYIQGTKHLSEGNNKHRTKMSINEGPWNIHVFLAYMDVSENSGTPKLSILIGCSIIFTIHFGGFPPIFGKHLHLPYYRYEPILNPDTTPHALVFRTSSVVPRSGVVPKMGMT